MANLTRRAFMACAAAMSAGKSVRGAIVDGPASTPAVRQAAPGQTWRYSKHDYFTKALVDHQTDRVTEAGLVTKITSRLDEGGNGPGFPGRAVEWIRHNLPTLDMAGSSGEEVQSPWGMILIDPHWTELQAYEKPIPLWPRQLQPGWSATVNTNYMTPDRDEVMPWQLTMNAHRWEFITVPAGRFRALRYHNQINFRFSSVSERVSAQREEDIWFAPEIGRWVARDSWGTFYQDVGARVHETSHRWELVSWV